IPIKESIMKKKTEEVVIDGCPRKPPRSRKRKSSYDNNDTCNGKSVKGMSVDNHIVDGAEDPKTTKTRKTRKLRSSTQTIKKPSNTKTEACVPVRTIFSRIFDAVNNINTSCGRATSLKRVDINGSPLFTKPTFQVPDRTPVSAVTLNSQKRTTRGRKLMRDLSSLQTIETETKCSSPETTEDELSNDESSCSRDKPSGCVQPQPEFAEVRSKNPRKPCVQAETKKQPKSTKGTRGRKVKTKEPLKLEYNDEGDMTYRCTHCDAKFWYGERINKKKRSRNPVFTLCCMQGQVTLPLLKDPPPEIKNLIYGDDELSRHYQKHIRPYSMLFSFTSMGGRVDRSVKKGRGPQMFQLHGENYHLMGSMIPQPGDYAKFYQMYIVDMENEIENRLTFLSKAKNAKESTKKNRLRKEIIELFVKVLDEHNPYVKTFRSARERFNTDPEHSFHMRIISDRVTDGRTYNTPTASEVAAIIPGDFNFDMGKNRDIILQKQSGKLRRISEIHPSYIPLQYPTCFVYGEDGFRLGIKKADSVYGKK
ncbi:unnamed protein product, partial [Microthlaspi erraticum]